MRGNVDVQFLKIRDSTHNIIWMYRNFSKKKTLIMIAIIKHYIYADYSIKS